ncbi:MAG: 2-amino-4-hydroxy-6-hydroxymethyldihydropteridine diphosphokinase [Anaerolineales bacterium]
MKSVYLGLGSNIAAHVNLPHGVRLLAARLTLVRISHAWQTPAEGGDGPSFLNAAAHILTSLDAHTLKWEVLRPIETALGRVRSADKFAPRPLDLDIILYDGQILDDTLWQSPHLAVPLAELLPDLTHPVRREKLADVARRLMPPIDFFIRQDITWEA